MIIRAIYFLLFTLSLAAISPQVSACDKGTGWWNPTTQKSVAESELWHTLTRDTVLLLGEHHANSAHHQWHIAMLKKLLSIRPRIALGLEVFPRRTQPILDQWIDGKLSETEFVKSIDWPHIWGYDIELYLPLLRFARDNRIPLAAINVDHELIQKIREQGLAHLQDSERDGVGIPAKPSRAYVSQLATSFRQHGTQYDDKASEQLAFLRFVEQQVFWDRAMSEALLATKNRFPDRVVVSIVGSWHLIHKQGIPYQLQSQQKTELITLIPWDDNLNCDELQPTFSDFVFFFAN